MSEHEHNEYSKKWQVFAIALTILLLWFASTTKTDSHVRDLQRRVGQLESQQVKQ